MLKSIWKLFALFFCGTFVNCAVYIERAHPNASPNQCISDDYKLTMKSGDVAYVPVVCLKAMCRPNGEIVYHGCGTVGIPENCRFIDPDLSLPYPRCCKTEFVCDDKAPGA